MSQLYEGVYSPEIIQAYKDIRQYVKIPIHLYVSELWNKGVKEHVESSLKTSQTTPYAGASDALLEHRKSMERLAIRKVSQLLVNKTHEECRDVLHNREFIQSSIVSAVYKMPGCRDPIAFLKTKGVSSPEQHHLNSCSEIADSIVAIWDGYKQKRLKTHNPIKFNKYFTKNMLKSDQLVAEKKERKTQTIESPTPGLRSTAGDGAVPGLRTKSANTDDIYADMPGLRTKSANTDDIYADMPGLRKTATGTDDIYADMPKLGKKSGSNEDMYVDMPTLGDIPENSDDDDMPSLRTRVAADDYSDDDMPSLAASASSLRDDDSGPPPLRTRVNFQKVGNPTPLAAEPVGTKTPASDTSTLIAVGWMEKYIQKNKHHLPLKNYIYFSPSDECAKRVLRSVEVMRTEAPREKVPFNPDKFVSSHLCPDFQPEKDTLNKAFNPLKEAPDGNYLIMVNRDGKIQMPTVNNPSLQGDGVVTVAGISVRVFVHDNIFNFNK